MSCDCNANLSVQLHDGGNRCPVVPAARHGELSFWFDARCAGCNARYEAPLVRVDDSGKALPDETKDLPLVDVMWLRQQCGPFTCGCDQDQLDPAFAR